MAPRLPDRYQTQVRLGRDGDVDEWLATDSALDRPVLVRALDPSAGEERRAEFIADIRAAAAVSHIHLAKVYEVGIEGAPYAMMEWNGGVSVADRLRSGDTLPVHEFLPNAAGLADGLAALHQAGVVHGAIDPGAIQFSAAHPAKLGAFGRAAADPSPRSDTMAMASTLRHALTGTITAGVRPSQVVEGLPRSVDDAISAAESGTLDAAGLAAALRAAPYHPPDQARSGWSWQWVYPAAGLLVVAMTVVVAGLAIDVDPDSPFLFPATPQEPGTDPQPAEDETVTPPPAAGEGTVIPTAATSFDPFGDNLAEREDVVPLVHDGDLGTEWRTERYFVPIDSVKPGVGIRFTPEDSPGRVDIVGDSGTSFELRWADGAPDDIDSWETLATGTLVPGTATLQLPRRPGGEWLLWLVSLPENTDGEFVAAISEVSFRP